AWPKLRWRSKPIGLAIRSRSVRAMACLAWVTGHRGVFTNSGHATALPWAHGYARLLACHLEGNKAVHASRRSVGNSLAWPHHNAGIWPFQLGSGQEVIS